MDTCRVMHANMSKDPSNALDVYHAMLEDTLLHFNGCLT